MTYDRLRWWKYIYQLRKFLDLNRKWIGFIYIYRLMLNYVVPNAQKDTCKFPGKKHKTTHRYATITTTAYNKQTRKIHPSNHQRTTRNPRGMSQFRRYYFVNKGLTKVHPYSQKAFASIIPHFGYLLENIFKFFKHNSFFLWNKNVFPFFINYRRPTACHAFQSPRQQHHTPLSVVNFVVTTRRSGWLGWFGLVSRKTTLFAEL